MSDCLEVVSSVHCTFLPPLAAKVFITASVYSSVSRATHVFMGSFVIPSRAFWTSPVDLQFGSKRNQLCFIRVIAFDKPTKSWPHFPAGENISATILANKISTTLFGRLT
jgi:hypothetical protein